MKEAVLEIKDLAVNFETESGSIKAVNGVSLGLNPGEIFGLVGESGCGKSVTALSVLRLVATPPGKIAGGSIRWKGKDLLKESYQDLIKIRGKEISMVFQEPMTSFNPVQKIGLQIGEVLQIHTDLNPIEIKERVIESLHRVGISDPKRSYEAYPHELSGGMRQRAMIAMALICGPQLLIADEPTTALDVTIQAQILDLLFELQSESKMAVLLITHNLGIVAGNAQKVAVMYAGKIVESATTPELFKNPLHPYTQGLLASLPKLDQSEPLFTIPGMIPDPLHLPTGCYFASRCHKVMEQCRREYPFEKEVAPGHRVSCWN
ncbi:MAG: ABC transporter ATP-binding protein [Firmicutes bacterium]|nr:ABC transporter ATP-binding protein [Bacillota bacterium]